MLFVPNEENDARINLAIENYLFHYKQFNEPILLFYINRPSIIIGKYQNTIEEINQEYVEKNNINVVRRITGGGAVYHDYGNLNYSFIMPSADTKDRDFAKFTKPIVDALHSFGIPQAELKGRNDLVIEDKKFSGNAMFASKAKLLAHGTIMFDSDVEEVVNALKVKPEKIVSKGIKSIRSRVTNIKPYLPKKYQEMDTKSFRDSLLLEIFGVDNQSSIKMYHLNQEDWEIIKQISEEKYCSWDWNYGNSPAFEIERQRRFKIGSIEVKLNVEAGMIRAIRIYGDFFGNGEVAEVEECLKGVQYRKVDVQQAVKQLDLGHYFGNISEEEFTELIC